MIEYHKSNSVRSLLSIFQMRGSVFPFAIRIALPCTLLTGLIEFLSQHNLITFLEDGTFAEIMGESAVWSGFTFLVGFAVVFRTSIAYARFWDGASATHQMRAEWFDACSAICAFCKHSKEDKTKIWRFKHLLIRLFSLMHAMALAEIEDSATGELSDVQAFTRDLIDVEGLDDETLLAVRNSDAKVQLAFQWIQQVIVENIQTGVLNIPPPILSRVFQELANGMVQFHEALKVSTIPFPFPYSQTCDALLAFHWLLTPVINAQWVNSVVWSMIFTFVQVFILWSLNSIAVEIENPFGHDPNDLDQGAMQTEMNRQLLLLIRPQAMRTPVLSARAILDLAPPGVDRQKSIMEPLRRGSIIKAWRDAEETRGAFASRFSLSSFGSLRQSEGRGSARSSVTDDAANTIGIVPPQASRRTSPSPPTTPEPQDGKKAGRPPDQPGPQGGPHGTSPALLLLKVTVPEVHERDAAKPVEEEATLQALAKALQAKEPNEPPRVQRPLAESLGAQRLEEHEAPPLLGGDVQEEHTRDHSSEWDRSIRPIEPGRGPSLASAAEA